MLEVKNITKIFPGVKALDNVSLNFSKGEIHALIGENGAGKSTLIKIITGILKPNEGSLYINGELKELKNYNDAIENKISVVNQEIQVIPDYSIAENIMLDKMKRFTHKGIINWKELYAEAEKYLEIVKLNMPPQMKIAKLSAAEKQLVQIAKALASEADILLLDEPTSSLTKHETDTLFSIIRKLKEQNKSIIFVSHKLEEVLELCDKLSVIRDGRHIGTRDCSSITKQEIVKMMIGRETKDKFLGTLDINKDDIIMHVNNICQEGRFSDISFNLRRGEILGFYGLVGSGRTELARIIIGEDNKSSGDIIINNKNAKIQSMADALNEYNLGYVSENRKEEGLILSDTVKTNIAITVWKTLRNKIVKLISLKKENEITNRMVRQLDIRITSTGQTVNSLSGGNQQKVSIAKWLAADCDVLIIDEPTVGVDVGAKESIHELIWDLAKKEGKSIIVISSDMPELVALARRILVFRENKIVGEIDNLNEKDMGYSVVSEMIGQYLA